MPPLLTFSILIYKKLQKNCSIFSILVHTSNAFLYKIKHHLTKELLNFCLKLMWIFLIQYRKKPH